MNYLFITQSNLKKLPRDLMEKKPLLTSKNKIYHVRVGLYYLKSVLPQNCQAESQPFPYFFYKVCVFRRLKRKLWNMFSLEVCSWHFVLSCFISYMFTLSSAVYLFTQGWELALSGSTWQLPFCSSWIVTHVVFRARFIFSQIVKKCVRGNLLGIKEIWMRPAAIQLRIPAQQSPIKETFHSKKGKCFMHYNSSPLPFLNLYCSLHTVYTPFSRLKTTKWPSCRSFFSALRPCLRKDIFAWAQLSKGQLV